eukprot:5838143-Karenia_brevis.AAC.1
MQLPDFRSLPQMDKRKLPRSEAKSLPTVSMASRSSSVQSHRGKGSFKGEEGQRERKVPSSSNDTSC